MIVALLPILPSCDCEDHYSIDFDSVVVRTVTDLDTRRYNDVVGPVVYSNLGLVLYPVFEGDDVVGRCEDVYHPEDPITKVDVITVTRYNAQVGPGESMAPILETMWFRTNSEFTEFNTKIDITNNQLLVRAKEPPWFAGRYKFVLQVTLESEKILSDTTEFVTLTP